MARLDPNYEAGVVSTRPTFALEVPLVNRSTRASLSLSSSSNLIMIDFHGFSGWIGSVVVGSWSRMEPSSPTTRMSLSRIIQYEVCFGLMTGSYLES